MYKIFLLFIMVFFVSCKSDPYPNKGENQVQDFKPVKPVRTSISADIPNELVLAEGEEFSYQFRAVVPSPGKPIIKLDELPAGASFDEQTFTLTWTPSYLDGNGVDDPSIRSRNYPISVWVMDSNNPVERLKGNLNLRVDDVARGIGINGSGSSALDRIYEGTNFTYRVDFEDKDYPNGPFSVVTDDFPASTKVEKITNSQYLISFSTDFTHVNAATDTECIVRVSRAHCREYRSKILVTNPAGHQSKSNINLTIVDVRQAPYAVIPKEIEQGLDVGFQFAVYDTNREISPEITFVSDKPTFGNFEVQGSVDQLNFSTNVNVKWTDIPPSYNGKEIPLRFKACVYDYSGRNFSECKTFETLVKISVKDHNAPKISRDIFPMGKIEYLAFKEVKTYPVKIRDGDNATITPNVEIIPSTMAQYVTWKNDKLNVGFDKAGIFTFTVMATSEYKVKTLESFVVEVFEEDRSKVIYLTDSTKDEEYKFFKKNIAQLDVMNPVLQVLDSRSFLGRDSVIIGTSVLRDNVVQEQILNAIKSIKNVLIASPLIEKMPQEFLDQITNDYKVAIVGRYKDIANTPSLTKMSFVYSGDFKVPQKPIKLKEIASGDSGNPIIFSTGVDTKYCRDVLEIADVTKLFRYKIGFICNRPSGGKLAVLGTEFADLLTEDIDKEIPKDWMETMLKAKVAKNKELRVTK